VATDNPTFKPPFLGSRVAKGMAIDDMAEYLNETALFRNQWGFRPEKGEDDPAFKDRVRELRESSWPRPRRAVARPQVAWGHFAANAEGNDLVIWKDESRTNGVDALHLPPPAKEPWLCISDFFRRSTPVSPTGPASWW
jgi:5-methyltetrahydrofolate--homocysteine methyltransferase